jgi:hypothetical protein
MRESAVVLLQPPSFPALVRHLADEGFIVIVPIPRRTHAAAMVPQIDGIGRRCMECWRGLVWDELTDIPRTLRPM